MQSATRRKPFAIDSRVVAVAVAIAVLIAVAAGAALVWSATRTSDDSDVHAAAAASQRQLDMDRHDYAEWMHLRSVRMSQNDHDRADQLDLYYEAKLAHTTQASDRANWMAFPGHAGFDRSAVAQGDAARRHLDMDRSDAIDDMRRH